MDRNTFLREKSREYGSMPEEINKDIKAMSRGTTGNEGVLNAQRVIDLKQSKMPQLYGLFKKNADSMIKYGEDSYPKMSYDSANNKFSSNHFNEAMNELVGSPADSKDFGTKPLQLLMRYESKDNFNGVPTFPCITTQDGGETEHSFLKRKFEKDDLSKLQSPGLTRQGMSGCGSRKCSDCLDCRYYQKALTDSLIGLYSAGDEDRSLHAKNLISTLNSWASHHDSRGGDKESCEDPAYKDCNYTHQVMSTNLRRMAGKLNDAYEKDYHETGGKSGGKHRDNILGNNEVSY